MAHPTAVTVGPARGWGARPQPFAGAMTVRSWFHAICHVLREASAKASAKLRHKNRWKLLKKRSMQS